MIAKTTTATTTKKKNRTKSRKIVTVITRLIKVIETVTMEVN